MYGKWKGPNLILLHVDFSYQYHLLKDLLCVLQNIYYREFKNEKKRKLVSYKSVIPK